MTGDSNRRYPNGANRQPPYSGLLHLEEIGPIGRAYEDLRALAVALPTAATRGDAAAAVRAIDRLFAADRKAAGRE